MADFPKYYGPSGNLLINAVSKEVIVDEGAVSRARNGAPKLRRLQDRRYKIFDVVMRGLSQAQFDDFVAHYDAHRALSFNFYWVQDGLTYLCVYGPKPYQPAHLGTVYEVSLELWESAS